MPRHCRCHPSILSRTHSRTSPDVQSYLIRLDVQGQFPAAETPNASNPPGVDRGIPDKVWLGIAKTALTSTSMENARIFTLSHTNTGITTWTNTWVITDLASFNNPAPQTASSLGAGGTADDYIFALRQIDPAQSLHRIEFQYVYEDYNATTFAQLSPIPGPGMTQTISKIRTQVNGVATTSGYLLREALTLSQIPLLELRVEYWIFYGNYIAPQNSTTQTLIEQQTSLSPAPISPQDFARFVEGQPNILTDVNGNVVVADIPPGFTPRWIVSTSALLEPIP